MATGGGVAGVARILLIADPSALQASISKGVTGAIAGSRGSLSAAGQVLTTSLGAGFAIAGAAAVKASLDFERAFTKIDASSNASAADIARWREEVMSLSTATGVAPQELADGLFFLASAGLKTSAVMETLEVSARAAASGFGEMGEISRLLIAVQNAYAASGQTAAAAGDTLAAAIRESTAEADDFSTAIGRVLPIAAAAGVEFNEVAASLSSLSNIGLPVNEGVTALRGLLKSIVAPTKQAKDAMSDLGISTDQLRAILSEQGLLAALQTLNERSNGNLDILRNLIPNVRALTGELGLTGENADHVNEIFQRLLNSTGSLDDAFSTTAEGPAFQFQVALARLQQALIDFGEDLLPTVISALKILIPALQLAANFAGTALQAFLLYKGLIFLPKLLLGIGLGLERIVALEGAANVFKGLGIGLASISRFAGPAAIALTAAWLAMDKFTENARKTSDSINQVRSSFVRGKIDADAFRDSVGRTLNQDVGRGASFFARAGIEEEIDAMNQLRYAQQRAGIGAAQLAREQRKAARSHIENGKVIKNFANITTQELDKWREDALKNLIQVAGGLEDTGRTFTLTAKEANRGIGRMARDQRTLADDLKKLDKIKVGDQLKKFLIEEGPQAIHAFVTGTKQERAAFRREFSKYQDAAKDTIRNLKRITKQGGNEVATSLADGIETGLRENRDRIVAVAREIARAAIDAVKEELDAESPSRVMIEVGKDFVDGFIIGVSDRIDSAAARSQQMSERFVNRFVRGLQRSIGKIRTQLQELLPEIRKTFGIGAADQVDAFIKSFGKLDKEFTKLFRKITRLRDALRSGFEQFDLVSGAIEAIDNFDQAQQDFLDQQKDLQEQLAEAIAEGDAEAIADLQEQLNALEPPAALDLQAMAQNMVAQAQELGRTLKRLQAAGLRPDLLRKIAEMGPAGIAFGQELLADPALLAAFNEAQATINQVLQDTSNALVDAQFGEKMEKLGDRFDTLRARLEKFLEGLDLPKVTEETRQFLNALQKLIDYINDLVKQNQNNAQANANATARIASESAKGDQGQNKGKNFAETEYTPPIIHQSWMDELQRASQRDSGDIVIEIDGREVFRAVREEALRVGRRNGTSGI